MSDSIAIVPNAQPVPEWSAMLIDAVNTPGKVLAAYSRFWDYSVGNQLLALFQCQARGIEPGPIHTFMGWKELGRSVRKGEKAIELCMPITCKKKIDDDKDEAFTRFIYRRNWFVLSQTDGQEYQPITLPAWDEATALAALKIERVTFESPNGNSQGYAFNRSVAVSPWAALPHKTLFHELAHVVLGHTGEGMMSDSEQLPKSLREVEAEAVALICCESLGMEGATFCRGYIQRWLHGEQIPEKSARRIFKAANAILKAGRPG